MIDILYIFRRNVTYFQTGELYMFLCISCLCLTGILWPQVPLLIWPPSSSVQWSGQWSCCSLSLLLSSNTGREAKWQRVSNTEQAQSCFKYNVIHIRYILWYDILYEQQCTLSYMISCHIVFVTCSSINSHFNCQTLFVFCVLMERRYFLLSNDISNILYLKY